MGASAAAAVGVPDRLFKKHGRWRSDTAKDGYVKESLDNMMKCILKFRVVSDYDLISLYGQY